MVHGRRSAGNRAPAGQISPTRTAVTEFHLSRPSGWPQGHFQVEILVNGSRAASRDFEVQ